MWNQVENSRFYRHRDRRLIPAIACCQCSICLIMFAIFFIGAGAMFRHFPSIGDDKPEFNTEFFKKHRSESREFPETVGLVLMTIGGVMISCALILILASAVLYKRHEAHRRADLHQNQPTSPESCSFTAARPGVDYPTQSAEL